mgnify:CR=1 FL=1
MKQQSTLIKYILYPIFYILGFVLALLLIVLFHDVPPHQKLEWKEGTKVYRNLDSEYFTTKFDSLYEEFGQLKVLPEGYELQALIALSMYPELKDVKITYYGFFTLVFFLFYRRPEKSSFFNMLNESII